MASIQGLGTLSYVPDFIKLQIIFTFCLGMLSFVATECRQITYKLPQECSQALSSSGPHPCCSSIDFLQGRPVCELQSIEDIVALRRNILVAGKHLVCLYIWYALQKRMQANDHFGEIIVNVLKALLFDELQRLFLYGSNKKIYKSCCIHFRISK